MTEDLELFLRVIDAPDDLTGIREVYFNLIKTLPFLKGIDPNRWHSIDQWTEYCRTELEKTKYPTEHHYQEKTEGAGLSNYKTNYPVYSALWTSFPITSKAKAYFHLQAHLINSRDAFISNDVYEESESTIYQASLSLRNIAAKPESLLRLPPDAMTCDDMHELLLDLIKAPIQEELKPLIAIERMLAYTLKIRSPYSRNKHVFKGKITGIEAQEFGEVDPDSEQQSNQDIIIKTTALNEAVKSEIRNEGDSPELTYNAAPKYTDTGTIDTKAGETPFSNALSMKRKMRAFASYNQQLPNRWDRLNQLEVVTLYKALAKLLSKKRNLRSYSKNRLCALIAIMHWTSSPYEKAMNTTIIKYREDIPEDCANDRVYLCLEEKTWIVKPLKIDQRKINNYWKSSLENTVTSIKFPIHRLFWSLIEPQIIASTKELNKKCSLFNAKDFTELDTDLSKFLSETKSQFHTRITRIRISTHLYDLLVDDTGDAAEAALITGRTPSRGQKTALFYFSPKTTQLQEKYNSLCIKLENTLKNNNFSILEENIEREKIDIRVGSRICPQKNTVKYFVHDLQKKIHYYKHNHSDINHVINYHNAYTAYCLFMINFATGYRSVQDPFYSESEIDIQTGFLVISDKDGDDYYHSRIVWLPEICREQIAFYSRYKTKLREKLRLVNPKLANQLSPTNEISSPQNENHELPFFFFLEHSFKDKEVKPKTVHQEIKWITDIPLNANRHYLRTHLSEAKVSGEIIDAFMGHWEFGQEPFGEYSTLSPFSLIESIKEPLNNLLEESGWKAIEGIHG